MFPGLGQFEDSQKSERSEGRDCSLTLFDIFRKRVAHTDINDTQSYDESIENVVCILDVSRGTEPNNLDDHLKEKDAEKYNVHLVKHV